MTSFQHVRSPAEAGAQLGDVRNEAGRRFPSVRRGNRRRFNRKPIRCIVRTGRDITNPDPLFLMMADCLRFDPSLFPDRAALFRGKFTLLIP